MGWGVGVGITLIVVSLEYKNYGGEEKKNANISAKTNPDVSGAYHCWLQMDSTLMLGQVGGGQHHTV